MSEGSLKKALVTFVLFILLFPSVCGAGKTVEGDVTAFVKGMYPDDEVRIVLNAIPLRHKEEMTVTSVSFKKVPDANGDGVCLVVMQRKNGLESSAYVPFKVLLKKRLFAAKRNIEKGEVLQPGDFSEKQTYLTGSSSLYPDRIEEIAGRAAKKAIPAGEVVTMQVLEEHVVISKGETVSLTAENKTILVQAKGTAMEKGRMGDSIRVKGASGREIIGRVVGDGCVAVEF